MKTLIKEFATQLGLRSSSSADPTSEKPASFYDDCYSESQEYRKHYADSRYYFLWTVIVDRIVQSGAKRVLEIGCGSGQLASYLIDEGISEYVGIDFSSVAIDLARSKSLQRTRFEVADALESDIYSRFDYDVLVCTEVLEHVDADLEIVSRFVPGKRALCTVPNFPYRSHVRHFDDEGQVADRYQQYFDRFSVRTFRRPTSESMTGKYFLFDARANQQDDHRSSAYTDS